MAFLYFDIICSFHFQLNLFHSVLIFIYFFFNFLLLFCYLNMLHQRPVTKFSSQQEIPQFTLTSYCVNNYIARVNEIYAYSHVTVHYSTHY